MRKGTHHITAGLLGFLLVAPLLLIVLLHLWQLNAKQEAKERMEQDLLQTIWIEENSLVWVNPDEVLINGELFDVKEAAPKNGMILLRGLFDSRESMIRDMLLKHPLHAGMVDFLIQLLVLLQGLALTSYFLTGILPKALFKTGFTYYKTCYHFIFSRILLPPPKSMVC